MDGTPLLVPDPSKEGRYYKVKTVNEEGKQNVKVILKRGFSINRLRSYN